MRPEPDTLVVGAGTAGCVVAARLSADPAHTVLVLEAGPVWATPALAPPGLLDAATLPLDPAAPWLRHYPAVLGYADGVPVAATLVRGAALGGSGAVNGAYFIRPPAADLAAWSAQVGDDSWSAAALAPVFAAIERDLDFGSAPYHGTDGPIPVRRPAAPDDPFTAAALAAGFPTVPDWNAPDAPATGVGPVPCSLDGPLRADTGSRYLLPALSRPNLALRGGTQVTGLLIERGRVAGVRTETETMRAGRVVLCAGAIESAALLLRSGIGPPDELRAAGIEPMLAAPVGLHCADHPEIGLDYRAAVRRPGAVALETVLELDGVEVRPYALEFAPGVRRIGVALMRPATTGTLRLRAADPRVPPVIEHNHLAAAADRRAMRDGLGGAAELLSGMAGARASAQPPAAAGLPAILTTSQHLAGSCRMGRQDDNHAVVDRMGRLYGLDDLWIADLSIVPVPLSRGPQAMVVALAELIAAGLRG
ncbi:mycofactocin system GMC family oxidoreductase MftG [Nocardia asteroides]|uniref:mycofactocin dehydrogenase MftG n=1 Tax=Nocardia asteroides TaxID=1824 RepID=UPI001E31F5B5|nr:mycofactocin system GMC family oxidoreductase MftG [Nocardia asteroides]UGT64567.1 mycofactocin system GMC family oxidoreductase MftG [Nocardia asteroides]